MNPSTFIVVGVDETTKGPSSGALAVEYSIPLPT
jgi:hypothetical protein